jgi:DNA-binding Lrp family transcriptional regulator
MPSTRPPLLDRIDLKILAGLQTNGRITIQKLAEQVGLSPRPCLERVRRLEAAKIISGYRAIIELEQLSRPLTVFAEIALEKHGLQLQFERRLRRIEEAVEAWQVSGNFDYLVRFVCADVARYEALTAELIEDASLGIGRIVSNIGLRPVHRFTGYPLSLLARTPPSS